MFLTTPLADLADFQFAEQVFAIFLTLLLNQRTAADDDVTTCFVDLEHFALNDATDVVSDVVRAANVHLASWQENVHADIDQQTTLILRVTVPVTTWPSATSLIMRSQSRIFSALRLLRRDHAVDVICRTERVLHLFDQDFDLLTHLRWLFGFVPFIDIDCTFALESDVDNDILAVDFDDRAMTIWLTSKL